MMSGLGRFLKWIVLLPIMAVVLLLAVANDQNVTVFLNPFNTQDPVLRIDLAFYQIAFLIFVCGALVGALVSWSGQRKYRARARRRGEEAQFWQAKAERNERRQEPARPASGAAVFLPSPRRG